jgi:hypothetical protein
MIEKKGTCTNHFGKDNTGTVHYQFNQQGFRASKDFDFVPDYAFFGCSLVFGIGVSENLTFPYLFKNSQNYGLAGSYDNSNVMTVLENFLQSSLYRDPVKIAVVWHKRQDEMLSEYYQRLKDFDIIHFFCGPALPYKRCYRTPTNQDFDVSNTHPGIQSHRFIWKTLDSLFRQ